MKKWSNAMRGFSTAPSHSSGLCLLVASAFTCRVRSVLLPGTSHSSHNLKCVVSSFAKSPVSIVRWWKVSQAMLTELRHPVVIYAFWIPNMFTSSNFKLFNRWWVERVCVFIILPHWGPNTFCHCFMQKILLLLLVWPLYKSLSSRQFQSPNPHQLQCLNLANLHFLKA